jgi:hypothetical protein
VFLYLNDGILDFSFIFIIFFILGFFSVFFIMRHAICYDQQTNTIKNELHKAIQTDNLSEVRRIFKLFHVHPTEEISVRGSYWTLLHYAVHFQAMKVLDFLIRALYRARIDDENFIQAINIRTIEGYNPAMVAVIYRCKEPLQVLLKYGGVDLRNTTIYGENIYCLAEKYCAIECQNLLDKEALFLGGADKIKPINFDLITQSTDLEGIFERAPISAAVDKLDPFFPLDSTPVRNSIEFNKENRELLLNGFRFPCVICLRNTGYLKYSSCCSQPYHKVCANDIFKCLFCSKEDFQLTDDIFNIEYAFSLL